MLTDKQIRELKPRERGEYMVCDGQGLYVRVSPSGRKTWVYRRQGKGSAKIKTLGVWPVMSAYAARIARDEMADKVERHANQVTTFRTLAERYLDADPRRISTPKHVACLEYWLSRYIYPEIGDTDVTTITSSRVYHMAAAIEQTGHIHTARRVVGLIGQVLRYGIPLDLVPQGDVTRDLCDALASTATVSRAHLERPAEVGELMRRIASLGWCIRQAGLQLLAYTFVRPGELRGAVWDEISLDDAVWRIPAERMKMRRPHIVPLARQSVQILRDLRNGLSAGCPYVLHAVRSLSIPMGGGLMPKTLRLLGYHHTEMSAHGFRATASTLLNEAGWPPDAIEAQLAHYVGGTVRAAYNHAQYLPVRRQMLQWYADYLDALRDGQPTPAMLMH